MKQLAVDTETTGVDPRHGSLPFVVTTYDGGEKPVTWEWPVDPLTRLPQIPPADKKAIRSLINQADQLLLQNSQFDARMLKVAGIIPEWPWHKTYDTLLAGHLLASKSKHNLTDMIMGYLDEDIEPYEKTLQSAVMECRRLVQQARLRHERRKDESGEDNPIRHWRIAEPGHDDMPSVKGGKSVWKGDGWLPRAVWQYARLQRKTYQPPPPTIVRGRVKKVPTPWWMGYSEPDHPFATVLQQYANADSVGTWYLWQEQWNRIQSRKLEAIYESSRQLLPIVAGMEERGITLSGERLESLIEKYEATSKERAQRCISVARSYGVELSLPKTGNNQTLLSFVFDTLQLPVLKRSKKTDAPSLDQNVLAQYQQDLPERGKAAYFINALIDKRSIDTAITYLRGYQRFWIPEGKEISLKIISGGQNGVDQAALRAARKVGLDTGGMAPKGWRTLDGSMPGLKEYGMIESASSAYPPRTQANVQCSDATLILAEDRNSPGERLTFRLVYNHHKPYYRVFDLVNHNPKEVADWILSLDIHTLNVAGNSEQTCPGVGQRAEDFLEKVFLSLRDRRGEGKWYRIYSGLNITGTDTTRFSSERPNSQNVSGKKNFNLRYCFGPLPGREWWSLDYANIELRIPAYASGEEELIALFENFDQPPYYGSEHILNFTIVYPDLWEEAVAKAGINGAAEYVKSKAGFGATWYKRIKNGDFSLQYGAGRVRADSTFGRPGSYDRLISKFSKKAALNQKVIRQANKMGYVETIPRKNVDPQRGYPLVCTQTSRGGILPTTPLSYYVQGTAGDCIRSAMIRVHPQLEEWTQQEEIPHHLILQIHDELLFDFPKGDKPSSNLPKIRTLQKIMEMSGDDIGVPLKVNVTYHPNNWSEECPYE